MAKIAPHTFRALAWQGIRLQVHSGFRLESVGGVWTSGEVELRRGSEAALNLSWTKADPRKLSAEALVERLRPKLLERFRQRSVPQGVGEVVDSKKPAEGNINRGSKGGAETSPEGAALANSASAVGPEPEILAAEAFVGKAAVERLGIHGFVLRETGTRGRVLGCFVFLCRERLVTLLLNHAEAEQFASEARELFSAGIEADAPGRGPGGNRLRLWSLADLQVELPTDFQLVVQDFLERKRLLEFRRGRESFLVGRYVGTATLLERTSPEKFFPTYLRDWESRYTFDYTGMESEQAPAGRVGRLQGRRRLLSLLSPPFMELRFAARGNGDLLVLAQTYRPESKCLDGAMESALSAPEA